MSLVKEFAPIPNLADSLLQQIQSFWSQSPSWIFTGQQPVLPITAGGYTLRGLEHLEQGHYREAIADFNQAITLDDHHVLAYFYRGLAHAKLMDRQRAIADYSQVIALKPNLASAYALRGDLHLALDALSTALDDYLRAELLLEQAEDSPWGDLVVNKVHWLQHKQAVAAMAKTHPTQENPYKSPEDQVPHQNRNGLVRKSVDAWHSRPSLGNVLIANSKLPQVTS